MKRASKQRSLRLSLCSACVLIMVLGLSVLTTASSPSPAQAQSTDKVSAASPPEVFATYHAAGIRLSIAGDQNRNSVARLQFRRLGGPAWRDALPLFRIPGDRFAGSIFHLDPGTRYEARIILEDPDGVTGQPPPMRFETERERFPTGTGRAWYVQAGAAGNGAKEWPFGSIQQGIDAAGPGDVVAVQRGIYREPVLVRNKRGCDDAYIWVRAEPGAVISGAVARLERPSGQDHWRPEGDGIFSTEIPKEEAENIGYVAAGEVRLFRYNSTAELLGTAGLGGGWYWRRREEDAGGENRLFAVIPGGGDPDGTSMRVARLPYGVRLENCSFMILEGLDVGFFNSTPPTARGWGIFLENSSNIVVRRNRIHHCNVGITVSGTASRRILIEENEIYDTSIPRWPWNKVKGTEAEGGGIGLRGGPGQVVRRNRVHGYFNGIVPGTWGSLADETRNSDLDIYENELYDIGDDPIEPEGTCINLRIWGNTIRDSLTGVSMAPITVGPVYVLRNTVFQHGWTAIKLGSGAREVSAGPKYVVHNTVVTTRRTRPLLNGSVIDDGVNAITLHSSWDNAIFLNNILAGSRHALEIIGQAGKATFDYNNSYTTRFTALMRRRDAVLADLAALRRIGFELHGISMPSRFVDLERGDLHLTQGSPEIDRATRLPNINDDFDGTGPDIGAYEWRQVR